MNNLIKKSRIKIDALLVVLANHEQLREYYKGYDNLQLGFMRLGAVLGVLGAENPYPQRSNPESPIIEPPSDRSEDNFELPKFDTETAFVKFIRQEIDKEITILRDAFKAYWDREPNGIVHEAQIALDSLKDAKMWYGQVLNNIRLSEERHIVYLEDIKAEMKRQVEAAYLRYGAVTEFKNFRGEPMPKFDELPDNIQKAWFEAVQPFDKSANTSAGQISDLNSNRCL